MATIDDSAAPVKLVGEDWPVGPAACSDSPSLSFVMLLLLGALLLHLLLLYRAGSNVADAAYLVADNATYLEIAERLPRLDFRGFQTKHFWGFPLSIALVAKLLGIPVISAMSLVSFTCGVLVVCLVHKLYGGFVGALFAVSSHFWMLYSLEGSSETLFAVLIYGGLLSSRGQNWASAGLLLGLAAIVRPLGVLAILAMGAVLLVQRKRRPLAAAIAPAAIVGLGYLSLLYAATGDPFANIRGYSFSAWGGGWRFFSWPVWTPIRALATAHFPRWTHLAQQSVWAAVSAVGLLAMCLGRPYRTLWRRFPIEAAYGLAYVLFYNVYNITEGGVDYPRFIGPIVPFILLSFGRYSEWRWEVLVGLGLLNAALAASAVAGMRAVLGISLP